ncbi:IS701 family transposase [Plantactinospora endophytica]|uniref:DDE transposase n=1 Tax=Plantactinospora endophytica TaxID=673535 RepID=A0ABQ4E8T2_9ACTN|nr:IS701 family transposase [Plantactinospora endophytica]GIG91108.1 DDE transposase [Plantactinospora endophytica]
MEDYAASFDELFSRLAQRRGFREYLTGLLPPRDRNKTLTGLAGSEPVAGAQHAAVQRLQYFLSQSTWNADEVNWRRLELLVNDPATAPHARGVIATDDSGDRKDGTATAHVGRQWLGRYGKTDNGTVTVSTMWADERLYYPLHAEPYTPASRFAKKRADPDFRTKLQIAADLVAKARAAGVACRAVVADCFYCDHDDLTRRTAYQRLGLCHGPQARPRHLAVRCRGLHPEGRRPGRAMEWSRRSRRLAPVERRFRDGRTGTWWATDAQLGWWGSDGRTRLVVATTDPETLPDKATWYLATNMPRPGGPHDTPDPAHEPANLTEVVRIYGIRHWIEQSYKQVKDELGWADLQVRSATALRRHQTLVNCAFRLLGHLVRPTIHKRHPCPRSGAAPRQLRREGAPKPGRRLTSPAGPKRYARSALAHPVAPAAPLLDSLDQQATTRRTPATAQRRSAWPRPESIFATMKLTNYR